MFERSILLKRPELEELTGTKQPLRMAAWLERRHWVYEPPERRGEIPKVSRQHFEDRMSGKPTTLRRNGPRVDFFLTQ
ncbi:hypothetical protein ECAE60S_00233 [Eoetvoesiella caeni]